MSVQDSSSVLNETYDEEEYSEGSSQIEISDNLSSQYQKESQKQLEESSSSAEEEIPPSESSMSTLLPAVYCGQFLVLGGQSNKQSPLFLVDMKTQ